MYTIITDMRTYIGLLIVLLFAGICMAANTKYTKPDIPIDKNQLYSSVEKLTALKPSRNYGNIDSLNRAADFIKSEFLKYRVSAC